MAEHCHSLGWSGFLPVVAFFCSLVTLMVLTKFGTVENIGGPKSPGPSEQEELPAIDRSRLPKQGAVPALSGAA